MANAFFISGKSCTRCHPTQCLGKKMIVVAKMVLHDFIRDDKSEDLDFARFECDPDYVPTILGRYNKFVACANYGCFP